MVAPVSPGSDRLALLTPAQRQLHQQFIGAVAAVRHDFVRMVLLVREIADRHVYRLLGFPTIAAYAERYANFTEQQTREFMAIGGRLRAMDQVVAALGEGTLSWTKAREICRHADPRDQARWLVEARRLSSHDLHDLLTRARATAMPPASVVAAPPSAGATGTTPLPAGADPHAPAEPLTQAPPSAPWPPPQQKAPPPPPRPAREARAPVAPAICHVTLRFTPEQYALWESLVGARHLADPGAAREELVLDSLAAAGARGKPAGAGREPAGGGEPPHLIVLLRCPECARAWIVTSRGEAPAARSLLAAAACDAVIEDHAGQRRRTVARRLRRLAMQRARYRCEADGCRHTQFLQIHHRLPREAGGGDDLANLVVLCARCHRALHEHEERATAAMRSSRAIADVFGRRGTTED